MRLIVEAEPRRQLSRALQVKHRAVRELVRQTLFQNDGTRPDTARARRAKLVRYFDIQVSLQGQTRRGFRPNLYDFQTVAFGVADVRQHVASRFRCERLEDKLAADPLKPTQADA